MVNHYGTKRIKDFIFVLLVSLIIFFWDTDYTFYIYILISCVAVIIFVFFMTPNYKISISNEQMIIYSFFDRKRIVNLNNLDRIEFEGIEIRSRGRLLSVYMNIYHSEKKELTVEVLNFSKKSFYSDLLRKASLNNFKIVIDDKAKELIQEYFE